MIQGFKMETTMVATARNTAKRGAELDTTDVTRPEMKHLGDANGKDPIPSPALALMAQLEIAYAEEAAYTKASPAARLALVLGVSSLIWTAIGALFYLMLR
jgi:hypothetical protein